MSAVMVLPISGFAAQWTVQPAISVAAGYDDNPRLRTGNVDQDVRNLNVAPKIEIDGQTETSGLKLGLAGSLTAYSGSAEDAEEQRATLTAFHRSSERSRFGLDAEWWRRVLYAYVEQPDIGDLSDVDTGTTLTEVHRDSLVASPHWTYALSELGSLKFGYRARDVEFSEADARFTDYKQQDGSVEYSRRLTEQDNLNLLASMSSYRPVAANGSQRVDSDTARVRLGWTRAFTETANGRLALGPSRTTQMLATGERETDGVGAEVSFTQNSEITRLNMIVSRDVQPSGEGRSVESDQVRLFFRRRMSELTALVVRARTFRNKAIEGVDSNVERRYIDFAPEIQWQLGPDWRTFATYIYRWQKDDVQPDAAESNSIRIGIAYAPRQFALFD